MSRTCSICTHPDRVAINAALANQEPFRHIADRYGTSTTALQRHKAEHMSADLARVQQAKQDEDYDLLTQIRGLRSKAIGILLKAESVGDLRTALLAIREARGCLELLAEMEGELKRQPVVNLQLSAEWIEVRTVLLSVLDAHPEAKADVVAALQRWRA
jgi:hypothetical protein